jgi:ParB-like chromosome segregation protein Spo0J
MTNSIRSLAQRKPLMTSHPYAELFPPLGNAEIDELAADIRQNGLLEPIVVHHKQVLDGRNRLEACRLAGVEPVYVPYEGCDPLTFVLAKNLKRRHLTESQRAMVAAKIATLRKEDNLKKRWESKAPSDAGIPASDGAANAPTQTEAAKQLGVSRDSVQQARKVVQQAIPGLAEMVQTDQVAVNAAAEVASLPATEQAKVVKAGPKAVTGKAAEIRKSKAAPKPKVAEPGQFKLRDVAGFPSELAAILEANQVVTLTDLDQWKSELPRGQDVNAANLLRAIDRANGLALPAEFIHRGHDALVDHFYAGSKSSGTSPATAPAPASASAKTDPTADVLTQLADAIAALKKLIKKHPQVAHEATQQLAKLIDDVGGLEPPLATGETRPCYPTIGHFNRPKPIGPKFHKTASGSVSVIDPYGQIVTTKFADQFAESRYIEIATHLDRACSHLAAAGAVYDKLSARPLGVPTFDVSTWEKQFHKVEQALNDGYMAWTNNAVPWCVCRKCNGEAKGCKVCRFSGLWGRETAEAYPLLIHPSKSKPRGGAT